MANQPADQMTIDQRRATGTPLVYRHNTMGFVFDCPFYGIKACGFGSMHADNPTEATAQKAWEDHHKLRHAGQPSAWPTHIPGQRPRPASRGKSGGDPNDVDPDQVTLW